MAATEDSMVMRKRLQAKDNNFKRVLNKFSLLSESLEKGENDGTDALAFGYLRELDSLEFTAKKVAMVMDTLDKEMDNYDLIHADIDNTISQTKDDILALKKQLAIEQVERKHREECEVLSRLAEKYPPRHEIMQNIEHLKTEMVDLRQKSDNMEATVELRRKQLRLIVHSLHELQKELLLEEPSIDSSDVAMTDA